MIRRARFRLVTFLIAALSLTAALHAPARADRRFFPFTYSPLLGPQGEFEIESWLTTGHGRSGQGTTYEPRVALEYGFLGRLRAAGYLNFTRTGPEKLGFESPSLEVVYALAEQGSLPADPALYLEVTPARDAVELESKLLLEHQHRRWAYSGNLIGEFEFRRHDDEVLPNGRIMKREFAGEVTGGAAYMVNEHLSLGLESRFRTVHPNFGAQSAAFASVGPAVNVRFGEAQLALGIQPQIWGTPATRGRLNLDEFDRTTVRAIFGIDL
jgi:hypothetical protein